MNPRSLILHPFEVRAIIDGRLSQIRRPATFFNEPEAVKMGFGNDCAKQFNPRFEDGWWKAATHGYLCRCPLGEVGDSVIGKETWRPHTATGTRYKVDGDGIAEGFRWKWRSPATMPAWASRITLTLTAIRVECVQEISEEDAKASGVPSEIGVGPIDGVRVYNFTTNSGYMQTAKKPFEDLWNSIYAKRGLGWDANPWCWVYTVKSEVQG